MRRPKRYHVEICFRGTTENKDRGSMILTDYDLHLAQPLFGEMDALKKVTRLAQIGQQVVSLLNFIKTENEISTYRKETSKGAA